MFALQEILKSDPMDTQKCFLCKIALRLTSLFDFHQKLMQWASTLAPEHIQGLEEEEDDGLQAS
jgi:hypothetical protein